MSATRAGSLPFGRRRARARRRPFARRLLWRALVLSLIAALVVAGYILLIRGTTVATRVSVPQAIAEIGSGSDSVGVSRDGAILSWLPSPAEELPKLPLAELPDASRLAGPALTQARVLGAAPLPLRPYLDGSRVAEEEVVVDLDAGVELRFGDASRIGEKWRAATAVLADPTLAPLDYVDLSAPRRPAVGGVGHELVAAP